MTVTVRGLIRSAVRPGLVPFSQPRQHWFLPGGGVCTGINTCAYATTVRQDYRTACMDSAAHAHQSVFQRALLKRGTERNATEYSVPFRDYSTELADIVPFTFVTSF